MGYYHIDNLYKDQAILMYKECYAMEKIHGTSAHITHKAGHLGFFAGGANYEQFVALFNQDELLEKLNGLALGKSITIYGEAYGGKMQGMSATYGDKFKFIAFEVNIGGLWLNVEKAYYFATSLGLDFVPYVRIPCNIEAMDKERDSDSEQAIRNGMGVGHHKEGIVLRPLEEVIQNNGQRVIAKHKGDYFRETATTRKVLSPDKLKKLEDAKAIADEWVTLERLRHITTTGEVELKIENTGKIILLMIEDILREAKDEIEDSPDARKQIGKCTALMVKEAVIKELSNE